MVLRKAIIEREMLDLPSWMANVNRDLVEEAKKSLLRVLQKKYGDNDVLKLSKLYPLVERVKNGDNGWLTKEDFVALFEVSMDLRLNNKEASK